MNGSRMILAASVAVVLLAGRAQAQAMTPVDSALPDRKHVPTSPLYEGMELTKAQRDSLDAITRRYEPLLAAINQENSSVRIRMRQMLVLREKSRQERRAVLTPAQGELFDPRAAAQRVEDERLAKATIAVVESRKP